MMSMYELLTALKRRLGENAKCCSAHELDDLFRENGLDPLDVNEVGHVILEGVVNHPEGKAATPFKLGVAIGLLAAVANTLPEEDLS